MAKALYLSKPLVVVAILFSVGAVATMIALAVLYSEEKAKNAYVNNPESTSTAGTSPATSSSPATFAASTPEGNNPWNRYRLPKALVPQHYDVQLQPYLEKNSEGRYVFKGTSTVYVTCVNSTNLILIHSKKLSYTLQGLFHISLTSLDGSSAPAIRRTWLEIPTQYLVVELDMDLVAGKDYSVFSDFTGELADDLSGFYRSEYVVGNETRIIATSHMQPSDARKAFPCFDEPAMKATFNLTLIHKPEFVVISNMPNISTTATQIDGSLWMVTKFERTPKMSTYLLAFIVSGFDKVEQLYNGVQIRIWARKKALDDHQEAYAFKVTGPILKFLQDYYNFTYPLPKSDQAAMPDFSSGAMENWGLVIYKEPGLLYDPSVSSISNKERVVMGITHELSHQWFGNLVTMRWWNEVWLNEGFAMYVHYLGTDYAEPSWNIKDLIVLNNLYPVMESDALASSHPLSLKEDEVNTPEEISAQFDSIAYGKGSSVIRMLSGFLTESLFVEGLHTYLDVFAYSNTDHCDLWLHLQKAVDKQNSVQLPRSIKSIMDTWILQMGFPVVTVNTATGQITQNHFLLDPETVITRPSEFNYTWIVPVTSMISGRVQAPYWLEDTSAVNNIFHMPAGSAEWVLVNLDVVGFYRVNYDQVNWKKLLLQLETNHSVIPVVNRAQIIDDAFNLARAKYINTTSALETTRFLTKETEHMPWQAALTSLNYFNLMFDRSSVYGPMKQYLQKQVWPLYLHFKNMTNNWTVVPDGLMDQYNEINAVNTACSYGIQECWMLASDLYKAWMADPTNNPITPNLRPSVYCTAIARGGEKEWDFAWDMFTKATVATETNKLLAALACSREPWILVRYLEYTLDSTKIRKQDAMDTITFIAANSMGQSLAWDFISANWETIYSQFGGSSFSFNGLIAGVTQRFSSGFELKQLEQFKQENEHIGFGSAYRELEQALEKTKTNIKWVKQNSESVLRWFEAESLHQ